MLHTFCIPSMKSGIVLYHKGWRHAEPPRIIAHRSELRIDQFLQPLSVAILAKVPDPRGRGSMCVTYPLKHLPTHPPAMSNVAEASGISLLNLHPECMVQFVTSSEKLLDVRESCLTCNKHFFARSERIY